MTDNGTAFRTLMVYLAVAASGMLLLGWLMTTCKRAPSAQERCVSLCGPQGVRTFAYGDWGGHTC